MHSSRLWPRVVRPRWIHALSQRQCLQRLPSGFTLPNAVVHLPLPSDIAARPLQPLAAAPAQNQTPQGPHRFVHRFTLCGPKHPYSSLPAVAARRPIASHRLRIQRLLICATAQSQSVVYSTYTSALPSDGTASSLCMATAGRPPLVFPVVSCATRATRRPVSRRKIARIRNALRTPAPISPLGQPQSPNNSSGA